MLKVVGFDWDEANIEKCEKHGLSTGEIEEVFVNDPYWRPDVAHSNDEERFIAIGRPDNGKTVFDALLFDQSREEFLLDRSALGICMIGRSRDMKKRLPRFKTDEEVEAFLERDLTDYITPENFQPVTFEFAPKEKVVNLRMSTALFESIKRAAEKKKIPYQRYIRQTLETSIR